MADKEAKDARAQTSEPQSGHQQQPGQQPQYSGQSTAMRTAGQGGQSKGLARRGGYTPSLLAIDPIDFFTSSPFELMRRFTEEMDNAFESYGLSRGSGSARTEIWSPAVDMFERDGNLVVRAELPGLNKDDVKVEITDNGLVIHGESKSEHEERGEGFYRCERSHGEFHRLIPLPEYANTDQVKAQFNNGVLEIAIPVPESQQRRREIPIESSATAQTQAATGGQIKS